MEVLPLAHHSRQPAVADPSSVNVSHMRSRVLFILVNCEPDGTVGSTHPGGSYFSASRLP